MATQFVGIRPTAVDQYLKDVLSWSVCEPRCRLVLVPVSQLPGASRDRVRPHRAVTRQASRSELSTQSNSPNSPHPGHIRSDPSFSVGRATGSAAAPSD